MLGGPRQCRVGQLVHSVAEIGPPTKGASLARPDADRVLRLVGRLNELGDRAPGLLSPREQRRLEDAVFGGSDETAALEALRSLWRFRADGGLTHRECEALKAQLLEGRRDVTGLIAKLEKSAKLKPHQFVAMKKILLEDAFDQSQHTRSPGEEIPHHSRGQQEKAHIHGTDASVVSSLSTNQTGPIPAKVSSAKLPRFVTKSALLDCNRINSGNCHSKKSNSVVIVLSSDPVDPTSDHLHPTESELVAPTTPAAKLVFASTPCVHLANGDPNKKRYRSWIDIMRASFPGYKRTASHKVQMLSFLLERSLPQVLLKAEGHQIHGIEESQQSAFVEFMNGKFGKCREGTCQRVEVACRENDIGGNAGRQKRKVGNEPLPFLDHGIKKVCTNVSEQQLRDTYQCDRSKRFNGENQTPELQRPHRLGNSKAGTSECDVILVQEPSMLPESVEVRHIAFEEPPLSHLADGAPNDRGYRCWYEIMRTGVGKCSNDWLYSHRSSMLEYLEEARLPEVFVKVRGRLQHAIDEEHWIPFLEFMMDGEVKFFIFEILEDQERSDGAECETGIPGRPTRRSRKDINFAEDEVDELKDLLEEYQKHVAEAYCLKCRKDDDESQLLICDCCIEGRHTYCASPKLDTIPDGDWFCCSLCKSKGKIEFDVYSDNNADISEPLTATSQR